MADTLYFVQNEDGTIKIGRAKDVHRRLQTLQTAFPGRLRVLGVIPDAGERERQLHVRFDHLRLRGEWFRPDSDLLTWIAENAVPGPFAATPRAVAVCPDTEIAIVRIERMIRRYSEQNGGSFRKARLELANALGWAPGTIENLQRRRTAGLLASEVRDVHAVYAAFLEGEIAYVAAEIDAIRARGSIDTVSLEEATDALEHAKDTLAQMPRPRIFAGF